MPMQANRMLRRAVSCRGGTTRTRFIWLLNCIVFISELTHFASLPTQSGKSHLGFGGGIQISIGYLEPLDPNSWIPHFGIRPASNIMPCRARIFSPSRFPFHVGAAAAGWKPITKPSSPPPSPSNEQKQLTQCANHVWSLLSGPSPLSVNAKSRT